MGIPSTKGRPWYVKDTWPAVVALLVAVGSGLLALRTEAAADHPRTFTLVQLVAALAAAVFLGAMKVAQSRYKDSRDDRKESPDDLRGCLRVLHAAVAGHKRVASPRDGWLRITLHRLEGDTLEQVVDYVGSEEQDAAGRVTGRTFSINAGLIGRVARTKDVRDFERPKGMSFEDWVKWLVDNAGMTQQAAEATRKDRYAFMGVPICTPGRQAVRAVVYLDSSETKFFDPATKTVIIDGCGGVAAWIEERYYSGKR